MAQLPFPHQIAHSPVYAVKYNDHDPDREGRSDVHFLTLGWAQWDEDDVAAKVVRHSGQRWSRQSEEVPVARLIDLTMLVARAMLANGGEIEFPAGVLENQPETLPVHSKSERARSKLASALHRDEKLRRRLSKLADVMAELRQAGQV